jgi:hypothetical protein
MGHCWSGWRERVALRADGPLVGADVLELPGGRGPVVLDSRPADEAPGIVQAVARLERQHLLEALAGAGDNVTRAAQQLGLTRNTLRYRLRKHGIPRGRSDPAPATAPAPPPRPTAAPRWERRRVVFLRVTLAPAPDEAEPRPQALLEEAREKIGLFGGALDGLSPAGLTAVFGLDLPEDAARRAAHAALAIRKLGVRARAMDATLPTMSVALHAMTPLLWRSADGSEVDAEARREAAQMLDGLVSGEASIIVSPAAAAVLRATFLLSDRPERDDGTRLLLDSEPTPRPPGPVFVGRREDMAMLQGRLDLALAGRGQVVGIAGEPGIGKSRMLHELRRALPADAITYVSAHAPSYGRDVALLPIVELVRRAHGIGEDEAPARVRDKLEVGLKAVGLAAAELAPFLLRLIGIEAGSEAIAHLGPETMQRRTLEAFRDLVLAASRARPLVLAVEDLHWMDRASESYLAEVVEAIVEAPVLLLTTFRSGYRPPWSERSYVSELRLQPLSRPDGRRVLEAAFEHQQGTTSLPATRAVLLARVDRLADAPKRVLQTASVLGRDVPVRLLEAVAADRAAMKEHLRELQRLEYLNDRSGSGELYRFKHALTQEVAYASLLPADRRGLHARIVSAIEAHDAGRLGAQVERLAHHALHGELWQKAAEYFREAGRRATARGASHEAIASLEQGLAALRHLPAGGRSALEVDLRLDLHHPLMAVSAYRRALDHLGEAGRSRRGWASASAWPGRAPVSASS